MHCFLFMQAEKIYGPLLYIGTRSTVIQYVIHISELYLYFTIGTSFVKCVFVCFYILYHSINQINVLNQ